MALLTHDARRRFLLKSALNTALAPALIRAGALSSGLLVAGRSVAAPLNKAPRDSRTYSSSGQYQGRTDSSGRQYDSTGRYQGRTDDSGRQYDSSGRYQGRTDSSGRQYDSSGRYQGRTDSNGRQYDSQGRYLGRYEQ